MVNRGSFQGRRKEFLLSQKADYALAVRDRHTAETLSQILRKYFKRFPIDLPDSHEPTEEQLASVDDNAPDPELSDHGTSSSESDSPRTSSPPRKKKKKRAKQSSKSRKKRIEFRREVRHELTSFFGVSNSKFGPFLPLISALLANKTLAGISVCQRQLCQGEGKRRLRSFQGVASEVH